MQAHPRLVRAPQESPRPQLAHSAKLVPGYNPPLDDRRLEEDQKGSVRAGGSAGGREGTFNYVGVATGKVQVQAEVKGGPGD